MFYFYSRQGVSLYRLARVSDVSKWILGLGWLWLAGLGHLEAIEGSVGIVLRLLLHHWVRHEWVRATRHRVERVLSSLAAHHLLLHHHVGLVLLLLRHHGHHLLLLLLHHHLCCLLLVTHRVRHETARCRLLLLRNTWKCNIGAA